MCWLPTLGINMRHWIYKGASLGTSVFISLSMLCAAPCMLIAVLMSAIADKAKEG
jgi:hypothetical protein